MKAKFKLKLIAANEFGLLAIFKRFEI